MTLISSASAAAIQNLKDNFNQLDSNHDNCISFEEIQTEFDKLNNNQKQLTNNEKKELSALDYLLKNKDLLNGLDVAQNPGGKTDGKISMGDLNAYPQHPWTALNTKTIQDDIDRAMKDNGQDLDKAWADLTTQRQDPKNHYDQNLAVAADYLRARRLARDCGPVPATDAVEKYMALKRTVGVPKEGKGPVSPYSDTELQYMLKGVKDETNKMSFLTKVWWGSPPGLELGYAKAAIELLRD